MGCRSGDIAHPRIMTPEVSRGAYCKISYSVADRTRWQSQHSCRHADFSVPMLHHVQTFRSSTRIPACADHGAVETELETPWRGAP